MKGKILFCSAMALLAIAACDRQGADPVLVQDDVEFRISGDAFEYSSTKAETPTHSEAEKMVNKYFVMVFDSAGNLCASGASVDGSCSVRVTRAANQKCYAIVNVDAEAQAFKTITTEAGLKNYVLSFSAEAQSNFSMVGYKTFDLTTGSSFEIPVHRMVAKVTVGTVETDFASPQLKTAVCKLGHYGLINVVGSVTLGGTGKFDSRVYNSRNFVQADCQNTLPIAKWIPAASRQTLTSPAALNYSAYCYPNPTTRAQDTPGKTSGACMTRFVISLDLNGKTVYYPINIAGAGDGGTLLPNKHYIINKVTITGMGSDSPDVAPSIDTITYTVKVEDWENEIFESVIF